jgi:haloalkane dehalogenase
MSIAENTIEVGKWKWFYRATDGTNDRPPILLLHGLPAHSFIWCRIMPTIAQRGFRAIAPDWLGSGFSDKPDRRDFAYTPDAFVGALDEFIAALELEKFSLAVQGFLGSVGLQYAWRYRERIEKLVILNTPLASEVTLPWQMKQWGIPFVGDMATQDPLLVDRTLEKGSGFVISDADLEIFRKPFLMTSAVGRSLVATIQNLKLSQSMAELQSGLPNWDLPTLIVWGMQDPWLNAEMAENFAKSCQTAKLVKLPEAKHYPQEHWPQEISEAIVNFLQS